ncbi:DUF1236 domain-containing protein [Bradyrhizobium sp. 197]|uniref:DUF1236 domain-containing protein n=1 Tax=Bradyrhizobium sp. 197 TaxID=2782663 RepID=UPI001FF8483E|nr:DUF1236 domain-containing protein [Bradyrhizobium sp. 197]MCK1474959.1 DUF1236 domain-containing protein [Bradyrhizobium sp. 197]
MAEKDPKRPESANNRKLVIAGCGVLAAAFIALTVWPLLTPNSIGTPSGGANPSTSSDTTVGRGAPAQRAAESSIGKNDPAGQEDSSGGRARNIKESSRPLSLNDSQRKQISEIISKQKFSMAQQVPFELMIGSAVPRQLEVHDLPSEVAQIMNGYWGDQYLMVQDKLVIVDLHSRRVVAIVPSAA